MKLTTKHAHNLRIYFLLLALIGVGVLIFAIPNVAVIVAFVTMGSGLAFASILVNLFIFMLALLPMLVLGQGGKTLRGVVGFGIGAAGYIAYLCVPTVMGGQQIQAAKVALLGVQVSGVIETDKLRSFEIRFIADFKDDACPQSCKALLLGGHADWVRAVPLRQNRNGVYEANAAGLVFVIGAGEACVRGIAVHFGGCATGEWGAGFGDGICVGIACFAGVFQNHEPCDVEKWTCC